LPLNEWITNVARSTFAVDAGCTFTFGRLDGRSDGKLDGTVFAIAVDKNAPSSRTYLANTARDAVVGQAKNRSPVRDGFEKFPQMFRRAKTGVLGQICLKIPVNNSVFFGQLGKVQHWREFPRQNGWKFPPNNEFGVQPWCVIPITRLSRFLPMREKTSNNSVASPSSG
jgi:hypothetical protein